MDVVFVDFGLAGTHPQAQRRLPVSQATGAAEDQTHLQCHTLADAWLLLGFSAFLKSVILISGCIFEYYLTQLISLLCGRIMTQSIAKLQGAQKLWPY